MTCDVVVTSRVSPPPGFTELHLTGLDDEKSLELFRLHSGVGLDPTGEEARLLHEHTNGDPLLIQVLGRSCGQQQLTPMELLRNLDRNGDRAPAAWPITTIIGDRLDATSRKLLRLMALLPTGMYPLNRLARLTMDLIPRELLPVHLSWLNRQGLIEQSSEGFAVHRLIAEAASVPCQQLHDYPQLLELLGKEMAQDSHLAYPEKELVYVAFSVLMHGEGILPSDLPILSACCAHLRELREFRMMHMLTARYRQLYASMPYEPMAELRLAFLNLICGRNDSDRNAVEAAARKLAEIRLPHEERETHATELYADYGETISAMHETEIRGAIDELISREEDLPSNCDARVALYFSRSQRALFIDQNPVKARDEALKGMAFLKERGCTGSLYEAELGGMLGLACTQSGDVQLGIETLERSSAIYLAAGAP